MTQQEYQYAFLSRRRQTLYRHYYNLKIQRIQQIRDFIKAGGDPSQDPDIRDDYEALWAESNGSYFQFEDNVESNYVLTKEQNKVN